MTIDEIKSMLEVPDAEVRLSYNSGWHWVAVTREHAVYRQTFTHRLPLEPTAQDISTAKESIDQWWTETTA